MARCTDRLFDLLELRGDERDPLGDGEHRALELRRRVRAVRETFRGGLGPADRVPREEHLHRGSHAEQPGMELPGMELPGMELVVGRAHEAGRRVADLRVLGHVHEVTTGRELASAGQAIAVDLRAA